MSRIAKALLVAAAAVAAAGLLVFVAYDRDLGRARDDAARAGRMAATGAGPIEYAETGAGIPLLSIHGAGGGHDQGLANVADLVGDGFRVIAPSRFGYLRTPVPADASPAAQADAHAALLTQRDVGKAVVVGISAGARSAVELAIRHPDRVVALVLIVPGTDAPASPVAVEGSRASALVLWLVNNGADFAWWATEKIAPAVLVRFIGVPPDLFAASGRAEQDRVMRLVRSVEPLSRRFAGLNIDSHPDPGRPRLEEIRAPTLVISARDDLFNTLPAAEFAARTIRGATLVVYDTGGHVLVGRQPEVRRTLADFLARHVDAGLAQPDD